MTPAGVPSIGDVRAAAARIAAHVPPTPVLRSAGVDDWVGTRVHLKAEHLHATGAFKLRGATNAVLLLDEMQAARGVAAHSSGNHAAALATAAASRGISCTVVMPEGAPATKRTATEAAGARVVTCAPTLAARGERLREVLAHTGAVEVHPFDDPGVIAGQGTATLELLEAEPAIRLVIAPVSGGGLLSGTAIAAQGVDPAIAVWGAEPEGADDAHRSLEAGHLVLDGPNQSMADGLLAQLSERTLGVLIARGVRVVTVTEHQIIEAMRMLGERAKQLVEPSGAVALAGLARLAALGTAVPEDVGVIVSGGNIDLARWAEIVLGPDAAEPPSREMGAQHWRLPGGRER